MIEEILRRVTDGESVVALCKEPHLPHRQTWYEWVRGDEKLADQYRIAQEARAELLFEELDEIANNASNDWMRSNDPDNEAWRVNKDHIMRSRLRWDNLRWKMQRLDRRYGDRQAVDLNANVTGKAVLNLTLQGSDKEVESAESDIGSS